MGSTSHGQQPVKEAQAKAETTARAKAETRTQVIPNGQLVILRENELDCDLATAIQRVREQEETSKSRILIVGPDEQALRRGQGAEDSSLPLPQLPTSIGQVARSGGQQALESCAERFSTRLGSLTGLFEAAHSALSEVVDAAQDGVGARLVSQAKVVREILSWMEAVTDDLQQEVHCMGAGFQAVDTYDLCQDLQGQVESFFPELRVTTSLADGESQAWGRPTDLAEGFFLALVLTAHRIGGQGSIDLQISRRGQLLEHHLRGMGEPAQVHAPVQTRRLREIIVGQHRGRIIPDSRGPGGAAMVIELPVSP